MLFLSKNLKPNVHSKRTQHDKGIWKCNNHYIVTKYHENVNNYINLPDTRLQYYLGVKCRHAILWRKRSRSLSYIMLKSCLAFCLLSIATIDNDNYQFNVFQNEITYTCVQYLHHQLNRIRIKMHFYLACSVICTLYCEV